MKPAWFCFKKNNPNTSHWHLPSELLQRPPILVSLFIFMWPGVRRLVVISSLGSSSLIWKSFWDSKHFPGSSAGKEATCNAGDPGSTPGSGRYPGEGVGYPLQYSRASLVAQMVKNPPAVRETWVQSLGWEDPLEDGMATHSSILAWRIHMDRGAWRATVHGSQSQTRLSNWTDWI